MSGAAHPIALRRTRGTTLVEALVALVVLAFGILAVARVQAHLRLHADVARQRFEAVRLAQEDLELLRAFAVVPAASGPLRSWDGITNAATALDGASGAARNTTFQLDRTVRVLTAGPAKQATVSIAWTDRMGGTQRVLLDSMVAGTDPAFAAVLSLAPAGRPVKGAYGRSARIPVLARNLDDGRSAFKTAAGSNVAIVVDNATGEVVARCTAVSTAIDTRTLTASDLAGCDTHAGLLVSGSVRFALGPTPDPAHAQDLPLPLALALTLTGGTYPQPPACAAEARKTVRYTTVSGSMAVESVPLAAQPVSLGLATWTDTGDRHVDWHCVVYPRADGRWSGRATIVPAGWSIGTGAADFRVCRYSADLDGSGAVDSNAEHPADWTNVGAALANQSFLVVAGPQACPTASPVRIAGTASDVFVDRSTVAHQP
jgi:Tfp pilus assembly protein PilV